MRVKDRINALSHLGKQLTAPPDDILQQAIQKSCTANPWFTPENIQHALQSITNAYLQKHKLTDWAKHYPITDPNTSPKTIGLVLAGNIPLVGFQDILCVFIAGHKSKIKLSDKDKFLLPALIEVMKHHNSETSQYFEFTEGALKDFDAVIATGSNNSARYFEAYFGKYPHIIRKNRNAVAILTGEETPEDLHSLGEDVYNYFGLGCRNVSKLYLPQNYDFTPLLEALYEFRDLMLHDRFKNNFDYQFALLILNKVKHQANNCILMTENKVIASPIASLYYEYYDDLETLQQELTNRSEEIQCVALGLSNFKRFRHTLPAVPFGETQNPSLKDYADGVDTMDFLMHL